ncbi:MAG: YggT family protein [Chroococcidiopsidaceae cyanobacterium CP_BM_ER_R8_30]|nr:YggT family protein [Chroococcidiopsidaceae cyanobacterium CP_BM_ER_R8_30]
MRDDHDFRRNEELRLRNEERRIAAANQNAAITRLVQLIYFAVGALGILLALRVILRLFGANPDNQFAKVIHDLSNPFVAPFATLFGTPELGKSVVLDTNALVAIMAYAILAWLVGRLIWLIGSRAN